MLLLRDGEIIQNPNNGSSTVSPRPSRTTTGNHILLTSNLMEDQPMLDALLLIQDGGNFGRMKVV
jgi:hypothetical protein